MKILVPIVSSVALLLVACDREDSHSAAPTKRPRGESSGPIIPTPTVIPASSDNDPSASDTRALTDRIHRVPDEELAEILEAVADETDADVRRASLTTIYEESDLRPPMIRLPLLLEIARSADVRPDVRTTIMAELGATLKTDHGTSWADWSLALEEHLAETQGLIRVE